MINFDFLAHKVTEVVRKGSEEVNVSYADPEKQSCSYLFHTFLLTIFIFIEDVSVSGRADLVDDNTKKKDLWNDSLKTW